MKRLTTQTLRLQYILGLLFALLLGVMLPYCHRPDPALPGVPTVDDVIKELKPDDRVMVVVGPTAVVEVRRGKDGKPSGKSRYVPPEGKTDVTIKESGEVVVHVKTKGLTFRPGIGAAAFNGRLAPVLDLKLAYWGRFGGIVGTGLSGPTILRPYGAVSYQVYNNTALFLGCSVASDVVAGIRLAF